MEHNKEKLKEISAVNESNWLVSRKNFVQTIVLSGIAIQLPWLTACSSENEITQDTSPLNSTQYLTILEIQKILFPDDGNGPGAEQINAGKYLLWVLKDPLLDPREGDYIIKGLDKLILACENKYKTNFTKVSLTEKQEFVENIASDNWGENWLSRILTLIIEALLLDPVYGGNPNKIAWDWLNHNPGYPRPNEMISYPKILLKHEI